MSDLSQVESDSPSISTQLTSASATASVSASKSKSKSHCNGTRWVWGSNGSGCLGAGHRDDLHSPILIQTEDQRSDTKEESSTNLCALNSISHSLISSVRFTSISCGGCHSLAVDGESGVGLDNIHFSVVFAFKNIVSQFPLSFLVLTIRCRIIVGLG